jgi:hypothetical protein
VSTLEPFHDDLPVVPGEVIGWRAWIVVTAGRREPRLRSLYYDVIWPTDCWLIATDGDRRGHDPHGVCAARDREHLAELHRYGSTGYPRYVAGGGEHHGIAAIGKVGLAGLIIPGDRGYRAEKARPLSILLPYAAWELAEPLHRAYRVPVGLANVLVNPGGHRGHRA